MTDADILDAHPRPAQSSLAYDVDAIRADTAEKGDRRSRHRHEEPRPTGTHRLRQYPPLLRRRAGPDGPVTLPYRLDGRDGVIHGWVKDDGLELRALDGEWLFDAADVLRLHAPPATRPTIYLPKPADAGAAAGTAPHRSCDE